MGGSKFHLFFLLLVLLSIGLSEGVPRISRRNKKRVGLGQPVYGNKQKPTFVQAIVSSATRGVINGLMKTTKKPNATQMLVPVYPIYPVYPNYQQPYGAPGQQFIQPAQNQPLGSVAPGKFNNTASPNNMAPIVPVKQTPMKHTPGQFNQTAVPSNSNITAAQHHPIVPIVPAQQHSAPAQQNSIPIVPIKQTPLQQTSGQYNQVPVRSNSSVPATQYQPPAPVVPAQRQPYVVPVPVPVGPAQQYPGQPMVAVGPAQQYPGQPMVAVGPAQQYPGQPMVAVGPAQQYPGQPMVQVQTYPGPQMVPVQPVPMPVVPVQRPVPRKNSANGIFNLSSNQMGLIAILSYIIVAGNRLYM